MLTIYIPDDLQGSLYEFIYRQIKDKIISKELRPKEKLPSKRLLSEHLQVSVITIEKAYEQLLLEGYIYSIEKKGYFVSEIDFSLSKPRNIKESISNTKEEYRIDLLNNSVSKELFPISVWAKITRNILFGNNTSILERCPGKGYAGLREAIAEYLYHFYDMEVDIENIIIGAGTEYLYSMVAKLLGKEKIYALEESGYSMISRVYESEGLKTIYIPMDDQGLRSDELSSSKAEVVHISPAHHFPTGITMPIKRRMEILSYIQKKKGYIIEDDYDSEFRLKGKPLSPMYKLSDGEGVIYMNTFSKTISPSLRISYMILPNSLVSKYDEILGFYSCSVSLEEQMVLSEFIKEGHFERHISRTRNAYRHIRNEFLEELGKSRIADLIDVRGEDGGPHFLIRYALNVADEMVVEEAKKLSLRIGTLSSYNKKKGDQKTLLINYTGLKKENVKEASLLLEKLFINLQKNK